MESEVGVVASNSKERRGRDDAVGGSSDINDDGDNCLVHQLRLVDENARNEPTVKNNQIAIDSGRSSSMVVTNGLDWTNNVYVCTVCIRVCKRVGC